MLQCLYIRSSIILVQACNPGDISFETQSTGEIMVPRKDCNFRPRSTPRLYPPRPLLIPRSRTGRSRTYYLATSPRTSFLDRYYDGSASKVDCLTPPSPPATLVESIKAKGGLPFHTLDTGLWLDKLAGPHPGCGDLDSSFRGSHGPGPESSGNTSASFIFTLNAAIPPFKT